MCHGERGVELVQRRDPWREGDGSLRLRLQVRSGVAVERARRRFHEFDPRAIQLKLLRAERGDGIGEYWDASRIVTRPSKGDLPVDETTIKGAELVLAK